MVNTTFIFKLLFAALLLYGSISFYLDPLQYSFSQGVNLIFHEAGHVLFIWGGQFLYVLGGTLGEIGIPLIITLYFLNKREYYGAFFGCWWLSTALASVSVYAADARSQALPLITGDSSGHDWTHLLGELGLLRADTAIGGWIMFASYVVLTLALYWLYRDFRAQSGAITRDRITGTHV